MKNKFFLISLSVFFFCISSCTRESKVNSKLKIQLPGNLAASAIATKAKGNFLKKSEISALNTNNFLSQIPTGLGSTGLYPINCYMVTMGGPTADLQRNRCYRNDGTQPEFKIGDWVGGAPSGSTIEIETSSGPDRVVRLFGFYTQNGACHDFRSLGFDDVNSTRPYLIGELGQLNLEPGATKEVIVPLIWDPAKAYDKCDGPDFNHGPGGTTGSGPYMRLEFQTNGTNSGDKYSLTKNKCYSVQAKLFTGNGTAWPNPSSTTPVNITLANSNGHYTFGDFFSASNCTGSLNSVSIGIGASASPTYYFKPTTLGSNFEFTELALASDQSISWGSSSNKLDIGQPYLVISGPKKLSGSDPVCAPFEMRAHYFEGGDYTVTGSAMTIVTALNNARYYAGAAPCAATANLSISTASSSTTFGFKINSGSDIDLGSIFTELNGEFLVKSYPVQITSGASDVDALELAINDTNPSLGSCVLATIRAVNANGAVARSVNPFLITVKPAVQGAGMFFSDPSCFTPTSEVTFPASTSAVNVYFKAYGSSTTVPVVVSSGRINLAGTTPGSTSLQHLSFSNLDPWYLRMTPPSFNDAMLVGTHELDVPNTSLQLPLDIGPDATSLECSGAAACSGFSTANCSGYVTTGTTTPYMVKLTAAQVVAGAATKCLRANFAGGGSRTLSIPTMASLFGPNFRFVTCATTVNNQSISSVNTLVASNSVVCLNKKATLTRSGVTEVIALGSGKSILGFSDHSSVIDGSGYANDIIQANSFANSNLTAVANVLFKNVSAGYAGIHTTSGTSSGTGIFDISNVAMDLSNAGNGKYGIKIETTIDTNTTINIASPAIAVDGANSYGIYLLNSGSSGGTGGVYVSNGIFKTKSASSVGLRAEHTAAININKINILNSLFSGLGLGLHFSSSLTAYILGNISVTGNQFIIDDPAANGSTTSTLGLKIAGSISLNSIDNNSFFAYGAPVHKALFEFSAFNSGSTVCPQVTHLVENTFYSEKTDEKALFTDTNSNCPATVADFSRNSFAYNGTGASSAYPVYAVGKLDFTASTKQKNSICYGGSSWADKYFGGGLLQASAITILSGLTPFASAISANSNQCIIP